MRIALAATCFALGAAAAWAQAPVPTTGKSTDSPHSTGRTVLPDTKGKQQPQGPTGPTETTTRGAPPESPQGQTPPGMQAAPEGSSKTIVTPDTTTR